MKVLSKEVLFEKGNLQVYQKTLRLPSGVQKSKVLLTVNDCVTIAPFLPDGRLILIHNFRPSVEKTLLEFPAGTMESHESPAETAIRELEEETGFYSDDVRFVREYFPTPGLSSQKMTLFTAHNLSETVQKLDPGESITPVFLSLDEAIQLAEKGEITDAKTLLLLFHLQGSRPCSAGCM
jgi:ADP-ribose pyrophosphatase